MNHIKIYSFLILCFAIIGISKAQNVGVGTTTPQNKLHVKGQMRVDTLVSGLATDSIVVVDPATGLFKRVSANKILSGNTTNTLSSSSNTMTNTTNGIIATAPIVNSVSNTFNTSTRALTTSVNGVAGTAVTIPNGIDSTVSNNGLSMSGDTVQLGGTLTKPTTIAQGSNLMTFTGTPSIANSSFITMQNTASGANGTVLLDMLTPNSDVSYYRLGKATTIGNSAEITFRSIGNNSDSNSLSFGFFNSQYLLNLTKNGNLGIGSNLFVPSQKLDVDGSVRVRTLNSGTASDSIVTADANGVLRRRNANSLLSSNLYTADGTLTGNRTVTQGTNTLSFTSGASASGSHFSVDGSTFSVDAFNNRIGVGTTSPGETLDVRGNMQLGNNDTTNFIAFRGLTTDGAPGYGHTYIGNRLYGGADKSELIMYQGNDADNASGPDRIRLMSGELKFQTISTTAIANTTFPSIANDPAFVDRMTIKSDGKIGLGTTSPTDLLDVVGTTRVRTLNSGTASDSIVTADANGVLRRRNANSFVSSNLYTADGTLTGNRTVTQGTNTLTFTGSAVNSFSVDGSTFSVDGSNNRIGIGTTSPGEALDVRGNARIGNNDTSNYIAFRGLVGDGAATYDHTFIGERRYAGTEMSELLIYKGNDTGVIASDPGPDRIRLLAGEHRFDTYGAATSGNFETVARSANNINRMIIKTDGKIGLGTSSPTDLLDVNGSTRIRTLNSGAASDSVVTADANGVLRRRNLSSTINEPWFNVATNTGATANNQNIYQMGNVGIGTSSPNERLEVDGNVRVGVLGTYSASATANYGKALLFGGAQGLFPTADGDNSDPLWIARYNAGNNLTEMRVNIGDDNQPEDKFVIGSSVGTASGFTGTTPWTPYFTVQSNGNVGVGTTTPNASAILDLSSTTKGIAIPRMTSAQRKAIASPTIGLQVYDTDLKGIYVFDGTWDCLNVPAGTVQYAARNTPPRGYLEANGQAVNRTTYAELFTAIGTTYGAGDGTTTFNVPDLRGEFVRGWSNGRAGVDAGRTFASSQASDNLSHTHGINDPGHFHSFSTINDDYNNSGGNPPGFSADSAGSATWNTNTKTTGITIQNSGGTESRPRNIALLPIIKF